MTPPGKKETLLAYLGRGIAMVHLDARRTGVSVPAQHADDPHLRLNLSYRYGIPDLIVDDEKVQATLSFRGRPFQCVMPWNAVFGITSQTTGEGQVWPEDLPGEVMTALSQPDDPEAPDAVAMDGDAPPPGAAAAGAKGKPARKRREPARKRPALVAVESAPEAEANGAAERGSSAASERRPGSRSADGERASGADEPEQAGNDGAPAAGAPPAAPEGGPRRGHLRLVR